jgi:DNA-binding MarR family transcriptional regulator
LIQMRRSQTTAATAAALVGVLGPLHRTLRKRAREDWPLEPLATAQVELLRAVRRRPGISVGEAAAELRVAPNTASTLANQLVAAGLVGRTADDRDRRTVRLAVTDAADERMAAWNDRRHHVLEAALVRLGRADREALAAAVGPLQRLLESLEP